MQDQRPVSDGNAILEFRRGPIDEIAKPAIELSLHYISKRSGSVSQTIEIGSVHEGLSLFSGDGHHLLARSSPIRAPDAASAPAYPI